MRKRIISIVLSVAVFTLLLSVPVVAATQTVRATPNLSFSGTTANCSATIRGSGTIDATLELWHGSTLIASWSGTGTNRLTINGTASVSHGQTYTLTVTGTVGGVTINATPVTKTCP